MPKVLVTGASGFIGGRLVEKLIGAGSVDVRALAGNLGHASRVARFDIEVVAGDIAEPDTLHAAVKGCDVVFNLAYDFGRHERNVDATKYLGQACLDEDVRRVVHVSTFSVYEPLPDGIVDEASPAEFCGLDYADAKLAVEREIQTWAAEHGLPVAVVQPTIVYGPYAGAWTTRIAKQLRSSRVVLPDGGEGICNAVYVDDVVDGLILASEREVDPGDRFLLSGPDHPTWRDFFEAHEQALGVESVTYLPYDEIVALRKPKLDSTGVRATMKDPTVLRRYPKLGKAAMKVWMKVGDKARSRVKKMMPLPLEIPDEQALALYRAKAEVSIDKARSKLGYEPRYPFRKGMELTERYMSWANL